MLERRAVTTRPMRSASKIIFFPIAFALALGLGALVPWLYQDDLAHFLGPGAALAFTWIAGAGVALRIMRIAWHVANDPQFAVTDARTGLDIV